MSTTVEATHEYAHDVETVYAAFSDPDFYLQKFEGVGARNVEVLSTTEDEGVFTVETSREVPLDVPSALKALLGEWTVVVQNEEWVESEDGEYLNELNMSSDGMPAKMTGTMRLYATDDGCVNEVAITIDCAIPFVGKKVEAFIGESTAEQLDSEYEFIAPYLDDLG